jgi:hypothetical protein
MGYSYGNQKYTLVAQNGLYVSSNLAGWSLGPANNTTFLLGDNGTGATGEIDIVNLQNSTGGYGGLYFYQMNTAGNGIQLQWYVSAIGDMQNFGRAVIGNPTGGYQDGVGSLNVAAGIWLNGSGYVNPDYVFDRYYGSDPPGGRPDDPTYKRLLPLKEVAAYTEKYHELPRMNDSGKYSGEVFHRTDRLLEKVEELTLYSIQQQKQIDALELRLAQIDPKNKPLNPPSPTVYPTPTPEPKPSPTPTPSAKKR